jgi:glutamine amidotransferase-like uncharacterized protein
VGICAGALFVADRLTYFSSGKNDYILFDPSLKELPKYKEDSLYQHGLRIPKWAGKDISKDIITLNTREGYIAQYFGGPVFDEDDVRNDSWTVLDRAYFGSTEKEEAIVIRKGRVTLIGPHFEFPGGNEDSYRWLFKMVINKPLEAG